MGTVFLELRTRYGTYKIEIVLRLEHQFTDSYIEVEHKGNDRDWVEGRTKEILAFEVHETSNHFFHSGWSILLYAVLSLVAGSLLTFLFRENKAVTSTSQIEELVIPSLLLSFLIFWVLKYFLQWLFPKIETRESKQSRIKKLLIGIGSAIIVGLAVNYIWHFLFNLGKVRVIIAYFDYRVILICTPSVSLSLKRLLY